MKAHELLDSPARWTQGSHAKTKSGNPTSSTADNAVCWCIHGAIYKCHPLEEWVKNAKKLEAVLETKGHRFGAPTWNDDPSRRWEEVRDLLREADL